MDLHRPTVRYDMYRLIHKAIRAFMAETLLAVGRMDQSDPSDVKEALERTRALASFCLHHLEHENQFVHPAMEARAPGSSAETAGDHVSHLDAIGHLLAAVDAAELAHADDRNGAAHDLYLTLAHFVGENFEHMDTEERHNNAVLWRTYGDDELQAIEGRIVASLPPELAAETVRWMVLSASPAERAELLAAMRAGGMPEDAFAGTLDMLCPLLSRPDWNKLERALGLRDAA